ncbi:hypothetical protein ACQ4PT_047530 [Festuca glaucescens]
MEVERPVSMAPGLGVDGCFTEADLAAADQLVQLSVSGGAEVSAPTSSSRSARSVNNTEMAAATKMADQLVQLSGGGGSEMASPTSSSLSARSVNNTEAAAGREGDHRDDDGVVDTRARKRYRWVAELYDATRPAKRGGAGGKRRRDDGDRRDRRQIDRRATWVCV